jgi:hypothetical protein
MLCLKERAMGSALGDFVAKWLEEKAANPAVNQEILALLAAHRGKPQSQDGSLVNAIVALSSKLETNDASN